MVAGTVRFTGADGSLLRQPGGGGVELVAVRGSNAALIVPGHGAPFIPR